MKANKKNKLIRKHNAIVEASYNLSVTEQKLLQIFMLNIDDKSELDNISTTFCLKIEEYKKFLDKDSKNYNESSTRTNEDLIRACRRLRSRELRYEDHKIQLYTSFVSSVEFLKKEREIILCFSPKIIPFLWQLKKNYTQYRLESTIHFSSKYAIRLFEMISSWEGLENWQKKRKREKKISIKEIKEKFCIVEKYRCFGQFKEKVILTAVDQINKGGVFKVDVEFEKKGRKFTYILFTWSTHFPVNRKEKPSLSAPPSNPVLAPSSDPAIILANYLDLYEKELKIWETIFLKFRFDFKFFLNEFKINPRSYEGFQHFKNSIRKYFRKSLQQQDKTLTTEGIDDEFNKNL